MIVPIVKAACNVVAMMLVLPCALFYFSARAAIGPDKAFPGWSQSLALIPGLSGVYLRRAFYALVLPRCGADACISFGTIISHATARIGRNVYVGAYCSLGDVTLDDDVLLASHVSVMNGSRQHGIERLDIPIREQPGAYQRVTIGRDSWIGERAVIAADVGRQCVIGAGAVVTKPIPDFAIAVGVPARVLTFRNTAASGDLPAELVHPDCAEDHADPSSETAMNSLVSAD